MSETFSQSEIEKRLADHPGWEMGEDSQLHRDYTFQNFTQALLFANAIGHLAEALNHHPDILIHDYKHLRISMMSHDVQGITARDFKLLGLIDGLPQRS